MTIDLKDYITLSPEGFPVVAAPTLSTDLKTQLAAGFVVNYCWAIIKDALEGPSSFDESGKTLALYKDCFKYGLQDLLGQELIKQMQKVKEFKKFNSLIAKGISLNPTEATPVEEWHKQMREYVTESFLPQDSKNLPGFVKQFNTAYPKKIARLGTHLLTPEISHAARIPSISNFTRMNIPSFSVHLQEGKSSSKRPEGFEELSEEEKEKIIKQEQKEKVENSARVAQFSVKHSPDIKSGLAVLRAKAEIRGKNKVWPKEVAEKLPLIQSRLTDIDEAMQCPDTDIHIVYNMRGKAVAYALTQQTEPSKVNVSYICSFEKGASKKLWRHLLNNTDTTTITANNVTNPITRSYYENFGFISIPKQNEQDNDMNLFNGNLSNLRQKLGIDIPLAPKPKNP